MMNVITLKFPKGLPKASRLCVEKTVPPDVQLTPSAWVRHHLVNNKKRMCL